MEKDLIFLESHTTAFQGKDYEIFSFIDPLTLKILYGSNLEVNKDLVEYCTYRCKLIYKGGKIKVISLK